MSHFIEERMTGMKLLKTAAISIAVFLTGCGKPSQTTSVRNADELAVLTQSSFHKNELTPFAARVLTQATSGDGGYIPGGPTTGGADGGSISAPGTGGSTSGGTTGGGSTAGGSTTTPTTGGGTTAGGGTTGGSTGGGTSTGGTSPGTDGGTTVGGTTPGGSDGGTIQNPGTGTGTDGGSTQPGGSTPPGDGGGTVVQNPPTGGGSTNPTEPSTGGGSQTPTDPSTGGGSQTPTDGGGTVVQNPPTGTGTDGGAVNPDPGGGNGPDGGVVQNPNPTGPTDPSDPSNPSNPTDPTTPVGPGDSNPVVENPPGTGTDPGGSTPPGNDGGTTPGPVVENPPGSDGGATGPGGNTPGGDGGSNPGGPVVVNPPGGDGDDNIPPGGDGSDPNGPVVENPPGGDSGSNPGGPVVENPPGGDGGNNPGGPVVENPPGGDGGSSPGGPVVENPPGDGSNPDGGTNPGGPVVENPPGGDGGSNPGGPVVENPPGDNGGTDPGGPVVENPPGDGGECGGHQPACPNCPTVDVTISRVCSERRSKIAYPNFVFFEEAKNPLLTFEATLALPTRTQATQHLASVGVGGVHPMESKLINILLNPFRRRAQSSTARTRVAVGSRDLSDVDLMEGKFHGRLALALPKIREWFPRTWSQVWVQAAVCDDANDDGLCYREKDVNQLLVTDVGFRLGRIPRHLNLMVWNGRSKTLGDNPEVCEEQYSPLVLDLGGDGFKFSAPEDGVFFNLNDTGELLSGWTTTREDAFLVRDLNGNRKIDSGLELFGSATRLASGERAANGFLALRELDTNANGQFDRGDAAWKSVQLWIDGNRNGVSERSELYSLDYYRMESINLGYVDAQEVDDHGNETRQRSTYRRVVNGRSVARQVIDVWFSTLNPNE